MVGAVAMEKLMAPRSLAPLKSALGEGSECQVFMEEVGLLTEGLGCKFKFRLAPTSSRSP